MRTISPVSTSIDGWGHQEQLVKTLAEGVVVLDRAGPIVLVNRKGTIVWSMAAEALIATIDSVLAEHAALDIGALEKLSALRQLTRVMTTSPRLEILSRRERQILELICRGFSDSDMAGRLGLSRNTIRNHVAALYRKLRINRRSAAVIWAHEQGLIPAGVRIPAMRRPQPVKEQPVKETRAQN